jgi:hypothetical protein
VELTVAWTVLFPRKIAVELIETFDNGLFTDSNVLFEDELTVEFPILKLGRFDIEVELMTTLTVLLPIIREELEVIAPLTNNVFARTRFPLMTDVLEKITEFAARLIYEAVVFE